MTAPGSNRQLPEHFNRLAMTPECFPAFHDLIVNLNFPIDVIDVLDLRSLINHAVDDFAEPAGTGEFLERMERLLNALEIELPAHRQRLLKTLTLVRELHITHLQIARDVEARLRSDIDRHRTIRRRVLRAGSLYIMGGALCVAAWFAVSSPAWIRAAQVLSLLCGFQGWRRFHALPVLDRQRENLCRQLDDAQRERVETIDWDALAYRLALVLGLRKEKGVQVFIGEGMTDSWRFSRTLQ